ncbi:MAG: alpha/beta hydrolase [Candidatus Acidiferrum sp.]|jgi:cephalosporin-C deacetylase-like acetyl esterase
MNTSGRNSCLISLLLSFLFLATCAAPANFAQQVDAASSASAPQAKYHGVDAAPPPPDFHEDWNNLSLSTSKLAPQPPLLGETDDLKDSDFVRQLYQVSWRPGDNIDLYVIRPRNVKKPPVILYLYDFPQDTDRFKNKRWCDMVTHGGYAAVGFVSALTGQRFHDRPMKEWFVSDMQESLVTSVHDVQMIISYLATREDLDMNRVGMFGNGSGASIAILAAAVDARIKALDVLSPWGDWPDWLATTNKLRADEHEKFLKPDFLATISPIDPVDWVSKIKTQRLRIQNLRSSPEVPEKIQLKIEAAAPDTAVIYQYGDDLALIRLAAGGGSLDWIKKQLTADPAEKIVANRQGNTHFFAPSDPKLPDPNEPIQRVN